MNRPIEGSQNYDVNYDVIYTLFGKGKEIGIEVKQADKRGSFLSETKDFQAKTCTASDMKLSKEQWKVLTAYRDARKTVKALANKSAARGR